jgi:ankyrin repeat protein
MWQNTTLQAAVANLEARTVRRLLENGANPNEVNAVTGWTLLHYAINAELDQATQTESLLSGELTCLLLDAGADATIRDHNDETPSDMAARSGHFVAVRLLRTAPRTAESE